MRILITPPFMQQGNWLGEEKAKNKMEMIVSKERAMEKSAGTDELDPRLVGFLNSAKEIQKKGVLDGEILVARNGKTLLNLQSADLGTEPQFMIGSVSKQFFAVALLKSLYESSPCETEPQKIADVRRKLQNPISQFLPEKSKIWSGDMPAWAKDVSLHHLLTHTSGILNYTNTKEFRDSDQIDAKKRWFESYRSTSDIIKLILKEPLLFTPGTKFSYCNTGYTIIAEIIEIITSTPAAQYLQQALFDPIYLSSTVNPLQGRWDELKRNPKSSRLVAPLNYDLRGDQGTLYPLFHCDDISVAKGGGSIISTSADLLKWNLSLHKNKSVLPKELYNLLITPNLDEYGYGMIIENSDSNMGVFYHHNGGIGSYSSLLLYVPKYDLSIILLSNIHSDFDKIEDEFNALVADLKDTIPDEREQKKASSKIIFEKYPKKRGLMSIAEEFLREMKCRGQV